MTTFVKQKVSIASNVRYVKYSEAKPGDVIAVGIFKGTEQVPSYDKSTTVPLHSIVSEDGEIIKLNSAGQLNKIFSLVQPETLVEVTFLGKEKFKSKDGRVLTANQFDVSQLTAVEA